MARSIRLRRLVATTALTAFTLAHANAATALPPPAPKHEVDEVMHGVTVKDPYRNLEDLKNPETLQWMKAEGNYAAATLARIDGRDAMLARVTALGKTTGDAINSVVRMPGNRLYYMKRKAGESQFKLMLRIGIDGAERILVDPEQLARATGIPHAVNYFVPSWDGRTVAYGQSAGGSEDTSLYLLDVASGKLIGKPIPRVHGSLVHFTPDSRRITYNQLRLLPENAADTETYKDSTVYELKVGDAESQAQPVFGPLVNRDLKLDRLDVAELSFTPGGHWVLARTTDTTTPEGNLFVTPFAAWQAGVRDWRRIASAADKVNAVQMSGDTLYLSTHQDAPRGKILKLDLDRLNEHGPALKQASLIVPEPKNGALGDFEIGRDAIYVQQRAGFGLRVMRHALNAPAGPGSDVAPDVPGSGTLTDDPAHAYADALFFQSSWTAPSRLLLTTTAGHVRDSGLKVSPMPADAPAVEVKEITVPSHDGAPVPLAILHRKGLVLDGKNPTLLIGYGSYGLTINAGFDARALAWIERGGVLAYANVRGSGAGGDAWYRAGFKTTKPNTWKDGIACAKYLISAGYATPATLGIWGTSAGGIFVGRSVTEAPQLFSAAIFDVGMMDAIRSEESANGATNVSEFGTVKDPIEFKALLEMSTYHHIEDGVAYPAVLLVHGMNDPRVDVWESGKAAARLQAATSSGKPILLRLDGQAGHGVGSTAEQGYSKLADIYSFLLWQFGVLGTQAETAAAKP